MRLAAPLWSLAVALAAAVPVTRCATARSDNLCREDPMNPSYLRVRRPLQDAMERYGRWIGTPEIEPPRLVRDREAIDLALADDEWRGLAVYIYASGPWTVFEELSGGLGARTAEQWLQLADGGDLVYAGYNDAIGYGELVYVEGGKLVRRFLEDEQEPGEDTNEGRLPRKDDEPLASWIDVARWVDQDMDELVTGADQGWLWIHRAVDG